MDILVKLASCLIGMKPNTADTNLRNNKKDTLPSQKLRLPSLQQEEKTHKPPLTHNNTV